MAITPLPPMPSRSDTPANFITKADAFLAALNNFATELNEAAIAINLDSTNSTSTSSLTVGTGSKTLTVPAGKSYLIGMSIKVAATASGSNWMLGDITSYIGTTLTLNVSTLYGSGTFADWSLSQSAPGGAQPGANSDITSLAGLTTPLSVLQGGSGASIAAIPSGTRLLFPQATVPVGWTLDVSDSATNRMLRVVNTAGGGVGGSFDPTYMDVVPAHSHGFTTGTVSADHSHTDSGHHHQSFMKNSVTGGTTQGGDPWNLGTTYVDTTTGYALLGGMSANHTHAGGTDNGSSQTVWYPRYLNLIIGIKN